MDGRILHAVTAMTVALLGVAVSLAAVAVLVASAHPRRAADLLAEWPVEHVTELVASPLAALPMMLYPLLAVTIVLTLRVAPWSAGAQLPAALLAAVIGGAIWMLAGEPGAAASAITGGFGVTALRLLVGALLASLITAVMSRAVGARRRRRRERSVSPARRELPARRGSSPRRRLFATRASASAQ